MGRKKKLPPDDPERSARFIETADRIQDENAGQRFEEIIAKVLRPKQGKPKKDKEI